jgi:hypothetical protein
MTGSLNLKFGSVNANLEGALTKSTEIDESEVIQVGSCQY